MDNGENTGSDNRKPQQNTAEPLPPISALPTPDPKQPHSEEVNNEPQPEPEPSEKWFKKPDWWIVALTALTVVVAGITLRVFGKQFQEMQGQTKILNNGAQQAAADAIDAAKRLERQLAIAKQESEAARDSVKAIQRQMRQDQRAWIEIVPTKDPDVIIGKPLVYQFQITNKGKTPATHIMYEFVLKQIDNKKRRNFIFRYVGEPRLVGTTGILNPQYPITREAESMDAVAGSATGKVVPHSITESDYKRLSSGDYFVITYARVRYEDIFGTRHWSKFCQFSGFKPDSDYYARWCTDYSSVDNN